MPDDPGPIVKKKFLLIFGTRPETIKMAPVIRALERDPRAECIVCVTGQHAELMESALASFGIQPHHRLRVMSPGQSLSQLTSRLLVELEWVIAAEDPDWVVVQGDTTSALAGALAAFYLQVPVAHVEAGLRSHTKHEPFPEEVDRRIIDLLAELHFVPTRLDQQQLIREGCKPATIHVTGNTGIDSLHAVSSAPIPIDALRGHRASSERVILVTSHRRENHGEPLARICRAIRILAARYRSTVRFIFPVHPSPNVSAVARDLLTGTDNVTLTPPLSYEELIEAASACYLVLTDSGGLQEELPSLGKPVLVLRDTTERGAAVAAGAARLIGTQVEAIVAAVTELMEDPRTYGQMAKRRDLFGDGKAGPRIAKILIKAEAGAKTYPQRAHEAA